MVKTQAEGGFSGFMWECDCGKIEYGEHPPEECPDCFKLDSFIKLPEELVAEREKDMLEEELSEKHISDKLKEEKTRIEQKASRQAPRLIPSIKNNKKIKSKLSNRPTSKKTISKKTKTKVTKARK